MRTIIILTIFAVLPISCRFYVERQHYGKPSYEIAQKILDTLRLADQTKDLDLFLSVFDKRFSAVICGHRLTYSSLRAAGTSANPVKNRVELKIINVGIYENTLTFEIVEKIPTTEEKIVISAFRNKFNSFKIDGMRFEGESLCPKRYPMDEIPGPY